MADALVQAANNTLHPQAKPKATLASPKGPPHKTGPHVIEFASDPQLRRKRRNDRKKSLMGKASELAIITGGSVLVHFFDRPSDKTFAFASDDEIWDLYATTGIHNGCHGQDSLRCTSQGRLAQQMPVGIRTTPPSTSAASGTLLSSPSPSTWKENLAGTSPGPKPPPHRTGPQVIEFASDPQLRRKRRNDRKKSLIIKANELAIITGGSVLVHFYDRLSNQTFAFASDDELWELYATTGIHKGCHGEESVRCNSQGLSVALIPIYPDETRSTIPSSAASVTPPQTSAAFVSPSQASEPPPPWSSDSHSAWLTQRFSMKPTGPHKIEYDRDTPSRRKKRNDRRKSLVQKAYELSEICGGDVFLRYIDEHNKEWAYSNREETWNEYVRNGLQPTGNLLRCDNTGRCCSNIHFVPPSGSVQQNTPPVQLPAENPYYVMKKEVAEQSEDSETESSDGSDEELSEASALASRQALANSSFTPLTQTVTSQIINHPGMSPGNASFASPNKQYFIANGDTLVPMNPTQGVSIVEYPLFNPITVKGQKRKFVEQPVWLGRPNVPVLQYVRPGAQPMMSEQTKKRDKKKKKSGGKSGSNLSESAKAADSVAQQMESELIEALAEIQDMDGNTSSSMTESMEADGNSIELVSSVTEVDDRNHPCGSDMSGDIRQNSEVNVQSKTAHVQILQNSGVEVQSQTEQYQVVTAKSPSRSRRAQVFGRHANRTRIIELPVSTPPQMEYIQLMHNYHQYEAPATGLPPGPIRGSNGKFIKKGSRRKKIKSKSWTQ